MEPLTPISPTPLRKVFGKFAGNFRGDEFFVELQRVSESKL
jgi:hypothetical protein